MASNSDCGLKAHSIVINRNVIINGMTLSGDDPRTEQLARLLAELIPELRRGGCMAGGDKQRQNNGRDEKGRFAKGNGHAWRPGQSGNPKGRPKSITLSEAYRRALAKVKPDAPGQCSYAEIIAEAICKEAMAGNTTAAREIADRVEGKPRQSLDIDMTVLDWRELARRNGLSEADVIREARLLIEQSDPDSSGAQPD